MTSARITATLCLVLLIIGQGVTAPTDDPANTEEVSVIASSDTDSAKQDHLDYGDAVDDQVHSLSSTGDEHGSNAIADADTEYEQLLPHLDYDYADYSSSDDEDGGSNRNEHGPITRSGNMLLTPLGYRGDGLVSTSSGYPEIQQKQEISQTLNPAFFTNQGQSNFPALHRGQVISQSLNPAYAPNHHNQDYRGRASAAKLLYLLGQLSNARVSSSGGRVGYGQYGHSSIRQPVFSGTLGGRLSYGQTVIRQPANSNSYGSLGVINPADSISPSSGSTFDFPSSAGSSYPDYNLGGQSLIKLIRPIAQFVAIQQTSPQKHWLTFLNNLNQAKISGSGAYQTLYQQINYESQRQQRIILLLKRYREIAARRRDCTQTGK